MTDRAILLVEDNPDDEALTLRAFKKHNITNHVVVAHDGAEALEYLFGTGRYAGRDMASAHEASIAGPPSDGGLAYFGVRCEAALLLRILRHAARRRAATQDEERCAMGPHLPSSP